MDLRSGRRRRLPGARTERREGQALVETAAGFMVFFVALLAVIDASLILYHQLTLSQAVKKTARRAGTNLYDRTDIDRFLWQSVQLTLIQSSGANVNATMTITTSPMNVDFASTLAPAGQPSVQIDASYDHTLIGGFGWIPSFTLQARAVSQITTWPEEPDVTF